MFDWNDMKREGWLPHASHKWGNPYSTIVRGASNDRFASERECKKCGTTVASRGKWLEPRCEYYAEYEAGFPCEYTTGKAKGQE